MKQRLGPFLVLLDAKYLPLLFAVLPQAYTVYLWLWRGSDLSEASFYFAVAGGIGYEAIYVGAIAWAEDGGFTRWTWVTAVVSLIFSVAVAVYVHIDQSYWSILHAGFPLVGFSYTMCMHAMSARPQVKPAPKPIVAPEPAGESTEVIKTPRRKMISAPRQAGKKVQVVEMLKQQPALETSEIAREVGVTSSYVRRLKAEVKAV